MSGASWIITGFVVAMWSIFAFTVWLEFSTLTHVPPISVQVYLEGINGSSYIYFMRIFVSPSQYWDRHNTLTVYGVEAYTGNTTVNCVVKPQLPITINNYAYWPEYPVVALVLYCPTPISNVITVKTNNGAYTLS